MHVPVRPVKVTRHAVNALVSPPIHVDEDRDGEGIALQDTRLVRELLEQRL